ncbi:hypothetical protein DMC14_002570 [Metamycoplasma phocicerebrale]|uniref:Uncharacterized protein n=1 Tax=Metamycoplasma phocicerebrale TaxID=142649 RepID=A0A3Q9VAD0_9BACT|nr:hypothetical protein [Metamycoplasma phocicerebrale]AZZ65654.2 hypothetical protein DMC14_002570 [Metamycoplasma phocicerebrale]
MEMTKYFFKFAWLAIISSVIFIVIGIILKNRNKFKKIRTWFIVQGLITTISWLTYLFILIFFYKNEIKILNSRILNWNILKNILDSVVFKTTLFTILVGNLVIPTITYVIKSHLEKEKSNGAPSISFYDEE